MGFLIITVVQVKMWYVIIVMMHVNKSFKVKMQVAFLLAVRAESEADPNGHTIRPLNIMEKTGVMWVDF